MAIFEATARIPCRPLSYVNIDQAENKEIIADYEAGNIYLKKADGTIIDITTTVQQVIIEHIKDDPTIAQNITINIGGVDYTLDVVVADNKNSIDAINTALGYRKDPDGTIHFDILDKIATINPETGQLEVNVSADDVVETATRVFVSPEEKQDFAAATHPEVIRATILGGTQAWTGSAAPYTQRVDVAGILETDVPVVDISLGDIYDTVTKQLDSYAYIYKIYTYDGYIMVYASQPTEVDVNIQMKVDR